MRKRRRKKTLCGRKTPTLTRTLGNYIDRKLDFGKITETYIGIDPGYPGAGPAG